MNDELRQSLHWIEDQLREIQALLASIVDRLPPTGRVRPMNSPDPSPEEERDAAFDAATQRFHAEVARIADVTRMQTPHLWPRRPFLCLRHATLEEHGLPKLGLLYQRAEGQVEPVVYCANVYEIGAMIRSEEQLFARMYKRYGSFEELAMDGWIID